MGVGKRKTRTKLLYLSFTGNFTTQCERNSFFHTIFAQTLTAHNICLTYMRPSILIYANALGYVLSIRVEFVIQNIVSIFLCCCIWKGGLKSTTSKKNWNRQITLLLFYIIYFESANKQARLPFFLNLAHYLEIKSKNTSKNRTWFWSALYSHAHYLQLTNIIYSYTYGYINKEPAVRAINRKGTFV